jgi:hypothetical protein
MKAKRKPASNAKRAPRPSRAALEKMVADLTDVVLEQVFIAEAIQKAAAPSDETLAGAFPMLKVLELAAGVHLGEMWKIHERADAIRGRLLP